jgi:pimeloyl-ACP methyl ester carboxylesterase
MSYLDQTRSWESAAGAGPLLRGRRVDSARDTIHFLPGNGFCGGVYWSFLKQFLPGHGLFAHDIEGHGTSDAPPRFSGLDAVATRIPQVLKQQGLAGKPLIGMGHSFGAAMSLRVAAENPGLFKALVLLDPVTIPAPIWAVWRGMGVLGINPMARSARRRREAWPSRDDALARLRGRGIFAGWPEPALADFVDYALGPKDGQWGLRCPRELEAQIYENPVYPWRYFRQARLPILFLHGAHSHGFLSLAARSAHRLNPGVSAATVPGGHCFMLERPAETQAVVSGFLKELG